MTPNNAVEQTAGSHSLAAAAHRGRSAANRTRERRATILDRLGCLNIHPNAAITGGEPGANAMLYMVETWATIERGDTIDSRDGPGPFFAKIAERFRPQAIYGNPTRRHIYMVVELNSPADVAELMYALTWFTGNEPRFTPIMPPETYMEAIGKAKSIVSPMPSTA